jgi:hypothetical protein
MSGVSQNTYDALYRDLVRRINPGLILDIGPGRGKYADLTRAAGCGGRLIGVEREAAYLEAFNLAAKYDELWVRDGADLADYDPDVCFDLVILGDCLEHIPKTKALDLLNFLTYRSQYIFIVAPAFAYYAIGEMARSEAHISVWSERDFHWHDNWAFMRAEIMQLFLLRGYQTAPISLQDLVAQSNAEPVMVTRASGEALKLSRLELRYTPEYETVGDTTFIYRHP